MHLRPKQTETHYSFSTIIRVCRTAKATERRGGGFHSELHFWIVEQRLRRTSPTALDADRSCWTNAWWMPFCIELRQFTADCAADPKPLIHRTPKSPLAFISIPEFSFLRRFWLPGHMINTITRNKRKSLNWALEANNEPNALQFVSH